MKPTANPYLHALLAGFRNTTRFSIIVSATVLLLPAIAGAQTTYTNGSANGLWSDNGNWSASEPSAIVDAILAAGIPLGGSPLTLGLGEVANSLTINDAYTLTGGDLTLTNGDITVGAAAPTTLSSALAGTAGLDKLGAGTLILGGTNTFAGDIGVSGGTLSFGADAQLGTTASNHTISLSNGATLAYTGASVTLDPSRLLSVGTGAAGTFNVGANDVTLATVGQLSGSGTLTKSGAGILILSAANTGFTGVLSVTEGTARVATSNNGLGTASVTLANNTTLNVRSNSSTNFNFGAINVTGPIGTVSASRVSGTGGVTHTVGLINVAADATLNAAGSADAGLNSGVVTLAGNATINPTGNSFRPNGIVQDSLLTPYRVTKIGPNNIVIRGSSNYSGGSDVRVGFLHAALSDSYGSGTVDIGDPTPSNNNPSGVQVGSGTSFGGGGLTIANNINVRSGSSGTLMIRGNNSSGTNTFTGLVTVNKDLTLSCLGGGAIDITGKITPGTTNFAGSNLTIGRDVSDTGVVRLTNAANDFGNGTTAAITVAFGTLVFTSDAALGAAANGITLNGRPMRAEGTASSPRTITLNAAAGNTIEVTGVNVLTHTGLVSGGVANATLTKTGTGTLELGGTVANTNSGVFTINGGTVALNKTANLGTGGAAIIGNIVVNSTGILRNLEDHQVQDSASVTLNTGGTWDLNGKTETVNALIYNGGSIANAGNLTITTASNDIFLFDGTNLVANQAPSATARVIYAGANTLGQISGDVALAAAQQEFLINNGTADLDAQVSGVISGAGFSINKTNGGTLLLSNTANTFGGAGSIVTVNGGVLRIAGNGSLGDAANTVALLGGGQIGVSTTQNYTRTTTLGTGGGGFEVGASATLTVAPSGIPNGAAVPFIKSGAGTLSLGSALVSTGALELRGGDLTINDLALINSVTSLTGAGGGLTFTGGTSATLAKPITLSSTTNALTVNTSTSGVTLTQNAAITGGTPNSNGTPNPALVVTGPGIFQLAGANTFTGNILVNGGNLSFAGNGNLGATTANANSFKSITVQNGGSLLLTASFDPGNNTTNADKRLVVGTGGGTVNVPTGFTYTLNDAGQFSGTGTLTKSGPGLMVLGQTNPASYDYSGFTGAIIVSEGTLRAFETTSPLGNTAAGTTVLAGGVLDLQDMTANAEAITLNGTGISSGGALINSGTLPTTLNGAIIFATDASFGGSGSGGLAIDASTASDGLSSALGVTATKVGTNVVNLLDANPNFLGAMVVSGGTLRYSHVDPLANAASATAASGGRIDAVIANSNLGDVVVQAGGFLRLSNTMDIAGGAVIPTTSIAGTLEINNLAVGADFDGIKLADGGTVLGLLNNANFASDLILDGANVNISAGNTTGNVFTLSGVISENTAGNGLTKISNGTVVLGNANTYSGVTNVTGGIIVVPDANSLGSPAAGTVLASNTGIRVQGNIVVAAESISTLALPSVGAVPEFLGNLSGTNEWTGAITGTAVGTGNFRINTALGSTLTVSGTITGVNNGLDTFITTGFAGTGLVTNGSGTAILAGLISGPMSLITTSSGTTFVTNTANTFTGSTRIQTTSTLDVKRIGLQGVAGSLGAGIGEEATIRFGNVGTIGTLRYSGTGADTTDRAIQFGSGGTGTINASGTGLLKLQGTFAVDSGSNTLALRGTGDGEFASVIGDSLGNVSVDKNDAGTWTLSADNTYTGSTLVNAGKLVLQTTGTINTTASVEIRGAGLGILELAADQRIADSAPVLLVSGGRLNTGGYSENVGTLQLTGTGNILDLGNNVSVIEFDDSSAVPWTGSMNILNWTGSSIGLGTDRVAFGANASSLLASQLDDITFTDPNVDGSVQIGTFSATLLASGEIVPGAPFVDGFGTWAMTNITDPDSRDPLDDGDFDGLANLIEYAFDTDPEVSNGSVVSIGSQDPYTLSFNRASGRTDITLTVKSSPDLAAGNWTTIATSTGGGALVSNFGGDIAIVDPNNASGGSAVTVTDNRAPAPERIFYRVEVSQP